MSRRVFAGVDLGASGGRVMAGTLEAGRVRLEPVHRFANQAVQRDGHLRWDIGGLYREVRVGLERVPEAESIGIDTWGVDYGLLDSRGRLLAEPIAYRDDRTRHVIEDVHARVDTKALYAINGLQFLPFNTLYQLVAEQRGPWWEKAAHAVLLPDLIAYWLTGELRSELTNASTTGLFDARSRAWSGTLLDRLDIPRQLLPPLELPGGVRGETREGTPVTTVASHDTASAVVGVPALTENFAYISSGTWSLVGLELPSPVLSDDARAANFSNEAGVDGRTRFLRNEGGLWLLEECLRAWRQSDREALLAEAARIASDGPRIEVDDPAFIAPGGMPERIAAATGSRSLTRAEVTRCILDSLAEAYARSVRRAAELAGRAVEVIHVVGGGSQNELLCQLTADAAGLPVLAGPVEATAFGNVFVQARAHDAGLGSLDAIRARLAESHPPERYDPR